jgi:hypothetical protein
MLTRPPSAAAASPKAAWRAATLARICGDPGVPVSRYSRLIHSRPCQFESASCIRCENYSAASRRRRHVAAIFGRLVDRIRVTGCAEGTSYLQRSAHDP